ncbi:MAG: type II secretion system F family protein [Proteobacteria bacterium]|nr:type II secretion system F family protein [Pseudomonadota bacterium]
MQLLVSLSLALGLILLAALLCQLAFRVSAQRLRGVIAAVDAALERAGLENRLRAQQWFALTWLFACLAAGMTLAASGGVGAGLLLQVALAAFIGAGAPWLWLRDRAVRRRLSVVRELPGYLDLITLGLEAGCAFGASLQLTIARSAPGPLRDAMERAMHEMRAGRSRSEALQRLGERMRVPALTASIAAIVQAEATGVSLAPVMRAQALRGTQERFARAEKRAMEAPVKMLAPLVLCIFPCTFIVIGFPIAVRLFWGF